MFSVLRNFYKYIYIVATVVFFAIGFTTQAVANEPVYLKLKQEPDSTLRFPFKNDDGTNPAYKGNDLFLNDPSNIKTVVEYDPATGQYVIKKKIGETTYGIGTGTLYGHVKLSDAINSTSGVSSGIAATP